MSHEAEYNSMYCTMRESFVMSIRSAPARMITRANVRDIGLSQHGAFLYNSAWLDS